LDVAPAPRQTYLEIADLAVDFVRLAQRENVAACVAQSAKRQETTGDRLQLGTACQSAGHAPRGISHLLRLSPTLSAIIRRPRLALKRLAPPPHTGFDSADFPNGRGWIPRFHDRLFTAGQWAA